MDNNHSFSFDNVRCFRSRGLYRAMLLSIRYRIKGILHSHAKIFATERFIYQFVWGASAHIICSSKAEIPCICILTVLYIPLPIGLYRRIFVLYKGMPKRLYVPLDMTLTTLRYKQIGMSLRYRKLQNIPHAYLSI